MIIKPYIVYDTTRNSIKIRSSITRQIKSVSLSKSNVIIVIGGDGFMLQSLKKYSKYQKSFYGINAGNYGFLMNKFSKKNFIKNISNANHVYISPLEMNSTNKYNIKKKELAINEVSILRQSRQASKLSIKNNNKYIIKKLISDGVLISTPAGSTAYNMSVYGPILELDSKKIAITPISSFRPRRWKGKIVNERSKIKIKNLDFLKRPVSAVADNAEIRNVKSVVIKISKKNKFNLMYNKNSSLQKKIKLEKIRNEVN